MLSWPEGTEPEGVHWTLLSEGKINEIFATELIMADASDGQRRKKRSSTQIEQALEEIDKELPA
eukprot:748205-Hanusia_phi.AAC.1